MQGIRIGDEPENTFRFESSEQAVWDNHHEGLYTLFDSASADIHISSLWSDDLLKQIDRLTSAFIVVEVRNNRVYMSCDE